LNFSSSLRNSISRHIFQSANENSTRRSSLARYLFYCLGKWQVP